MAFFFERHGWFVLVPSMLRVLLDERRYPARVMDPLGETPGGGV